MDTEWSIIVECGVLEEVVSVQYILSNSKVVSSLIDIWEYRRLYLDWYRLQKRYWSKAFDKYKKKQIV